MDNLPPMPEISDETRQFILKKSTLILAVQQAVANGMKGFEGASEQEFAFLIEDMKNTIPTTQGIATTDFLISKGGYKTIIFSHEFLKAFFGNNWQNHAKEMVITENPLLYLVPFIKPVEPKPEWR